MSTHSVDVLKVTYVEPHPNADALEIIKAYEYDCIVRKGQFKIGDLFAFIEPDNVIDTKRPEFEFLAIKANADGKLRIRTMRLRGFRSYGLVIPAPEGSQEGDNLWDALGIERYEPKVNNGPRGAGNLIGGLQVRGPELKAYVYDLENFKKYGKCLAEDEDVVFSVKIHGSSYRAVFSSADNQFFVGSRTTWKMKPGTPLAPIVVVNESDGADQVIERVAPECTWWTAAEQNPWLEAWCRENPDCVVYGEVFGPQVQGKQFSYGKTDGQFGIAVFDVLVNGKWVDNIDLHTNIRFANLQRVPVLHTGKLDRELLSNLAELPETFGYSQDDKTQIREGVVVKPFRERYDRCVGRVALKWVSDQYLDRT